MNITVIILSIIAIGLIICLALLVAYGIIRNDKNKQGAKEPCSSVTDLESLIVLDNLAPCVRDGVTTNLYYIQEKDMVVAPYGTSPLDVCIAFCQTYMNSKCTGDNYAGKTAQQNFDQCMVSLSSNTCIPPQPIARKQDILYYPYSPTKANCS